jgi:ribosomal protein L11 methyltransferase
MREGLLPHSISTVMRLDTSEHKARATTELFGEMLDPLETAVAAFEDEESGIWRLEVYFASPPDEALIRGLVEQVAGKPSAAAAVFDAVDPRDWVKTSYDGLPPVPAGRFLVHGSHDRAALAHHPHIIGLEIEAALAFGTGHHGTTRGCLLMLASLLKRRRPRHVLDVGTGTGVLAIAAARAARCLAMASDIDPIAVEVARDNARLNRASAFMRFAVAPGLRHPDIVGQGPYDLIFANILAKPLTRLAPSLCQALAPAGDIVLSGLLLCDVPGILAAYRLQGLTLKQAIKLEGWATLHLKRGGSHPRPACR